MGKSEMSVPVKWICVKPRFDLCFQANVGDSRAVASVRGRADILSNDHKPGNDVETRRIIAAGGWVEFNRVNGKPRSLLG